MRNLNNKEESNAEVEEETNLLEKEVSESKHASDGESGDQGEDEVKGLLETQQARMEPPRKKKKVKSGTSDFWSMYPRMNESLQYFPLSDGGRDLLKEGRSMIGIANAEKLEEKWSELKIQEVELYLKRLELIREEIKLELAEMNLGLHHVSDSF